MRELDGKVAVLTGAAGGIGLSLAQALVAAGTKVVLADRDADRLAEAVEAVRAVASGGAAIGVPTDVSSAADVDALAAAALAEFGSVDLVCNNAGVWGMGAQWETDLAEWHRIIDVNLWGVIHGVRSFVPLLQANPSGGHLVNTASMAGLVAGPFRGPYTAAKHAVVGLSRGLRAEFRARSLPISVSVVCPGKVDTQIFDSVGAPDTAVAADVLALAQSIRDVPSVAASSVGESIRDGIRTDDFWIFPAVAGQSRAVRREFDRVLDALERSDTESAVP